MSAARGDPPREQPEQAREGLARGAHRAVLLHQMPGGEPLLLGHAREQAIGLLRLDRHRANRAAAVPGEHLAQAPAAESAVAVVEERRLHGEIVPHRAPAGPVGLSGVPPSGWAVGDLGSRGMAKSDRTRESARMNGFQVNYHLDPDERPRKRRGRPRGSAGHLPLPHLSSEGPRQVSDQPREAGSARARLAPELSSPSTSLRLVATATMWEEIVDALQAINGGPHPGFRAVHAKGTVLRGHLHRDARGEAALARRPPAGRPRRDDRSLLKRQRPPANSGCRPARGPWHGRQVPPPGRRGDRHRLGATRRLPRPQPRGLPGDDPRPHPGPGDRPAGSGEARRLSSRSIPRPASRCRRDCPSLPPPPASPPPTTGPSTPSAWSTPTAEPTGAATPGSRRRAPST